MPPKRQMPEAASSGEDPPAKRGPGRPLGSKNKPPAIGRRPEKSTTPTTRSTSVPQGISVPQLPRAVNELTAQLHVYIKAIQADHRRNMEHQREMELKKEKELQPQLERLDEVLAEMGEIYHHVCDRNKFLALKLRQMNAAYAKQLEYQERTNETIRSLQEKVDMVEKSCEEKLNMVLTKGYMLMERSEEKVDMMLKSLQDIQQQLQERIENRQFVPCGGVGQQPPASLQEDSGEMSDETSIVTSAVSSSPNEPPEFVRQKCSNSLWQAYREWFYGDKCVTAFDKAYKNKWREKEPLRRWYFRNKKFMLELKKYIDLRPFPDSYHVSRLQVHIDTRFHSLNKLRDYVRQELEHRSATSVFNDLVCPPVEPTITPQLLGKLQLFA